jgi:hypothetical protein
MSVRLDWHLLPAEGNTEPAPEQVAPLGTYGKRLWERLWVSPEATMWRDEDVHAVSRRCELEDTWRNIYTQHPERDEVSMMKAISAQIDVLDNRLGLTPYGRTRLHWQIVPRAEIPGSQDDEKSVPVKRPRLQVVDTQATG